MLAESMKMSWTNITRNKLRSFLTMLGIVIGVASVITLITLVQGATGNISTEVTELGGNRIFVSVVGTAIKQGLTQGDVETICQIDNISGISPTIKGRSMVVHQNKTLSDITVEGKNEVYFQADPNLLQSGRPINILDLEDKSQVAVIGSKLARELFFGMDPIGEVITIHGTSYKVIGTLKETKGFSMGSTNDTVIIPYTTALRSLGVKSISSLDAYLKDTTLADTTVMDIKGVLNRAFNYREEAYTVFNMGDIIASFQSILSMMSLLLAGIAAISLIVGGIGIMNMMLVSVTERTTEIGLRKALGATPQMIQLQFIIEALLLSVIGGLAGLALGAVLAYLLAAFIGIGVFITLSTNALAIGFSLAVGILFGFMPAKKASQLNPIDALRSL